MGSKDRVPIIYHDFLFPVAPFKVPINKITYAQLMAYNQRRKNKKSEMIISEETNAKANTPPATPSKTRSRTVSATVASLSRNAKSESKSKSKRVTDMNSLHSFLEDNFCSFADLFSSVPCEFRIQCRGEISECE